MSLVAGGLENDFYVEGDMTLDSDSGKVLVYSGNDNGWIETSPVDPKTKKDHAQAYLNSIGITEDIDSILAKLYPEYMV